MVSLRTLTLRYEGLFDFEGLYHHIIGFFTTRQYDYVEKRWKEKDATPVGREITVNMAPEKKVNEYIKYKYSIEWKSIDVHDVEVVRDGQTVTLTHARFHFVVSAELEIDWQGLGKKHAGLKKVFDEYAYKTEIEEKHAGDLLMEMQGLLDHIKDYLHMEVTRVQKA